MSDWAASSVEDGSLVSASLDMEDAGLSPGNAENGLTDSTPGVTEGVIWRDCGQMVRMST